MFLRAVSEAVRFTLLLAALIVLPGMAVLYSDWRHHRGLFK